MKKLELNIKREKNEPEISRLKRYDFKLAKVSSSPADFGNMPGEPNSAQYHYNTRGHSPFSSQKEPIRPKHEEKYAQDLIKIQSSIIKSMNSSPNSLYGFSTQASSEIPGNPSLKSFKSLFHNDEKSSSKTNQHFLYSFKEIDDKYSQYESCQATPQKPRSGFSNSPSFAILTPTLNKHSSVQDTPMMSTQASFNRRNTAMGERKLTFDYSNYLKDGKNETVMKNQARSKSPIQWIDEDPTRKTEGQLKNHSPAQTKTTQDISSDPYVPSLRKNDSVAMSMQVLPRKIIKFGLQS